MNTADLPEFLKVMGLIMVSGCAIIIGWCILRTFFIVYENYYDIIELRRQVRELISEQTQRYLANRETTDLEKERERNIKQRIMDVKRSKK